MRIMVAGCTGSQMADIQGIKYVTGMTEKTLTVVGDLKVFFRDSEPHAPLLACAELEAAAARQSNTVKGRPALTKRSGQDALFFMNPQKMHTPIIWSFC